MLLLSVGVKRGVTQVGLVAVLALVVSAVHVVLTAAATPRLFEVVALLAVRKLIVLAGLLLAVVELLGGLLLAGLVLGLLL